MYAFYMEGFNRRLEIKECYTTYKVEMHLLQMQNHRERCVFVFSNFFESSPQSLRGIQYDAP